MLVVNLTPSSTAEGSPESGVVGTVESGHRLHGQVPAGGVACAVMNVFDTAVITCTELVLRSAYGDRDRGARREARLPG